MRDSARAAAHLVSSSVPVSPPRFGGELKKVSTLRATAARPAAVATRGLLSNCRTNMPTRPQTSVRPNGQLGRLRRIVTPTPDTIAMSRALNGPRAYQTNPSRTA